MFRADASAQAAKTRNINVHASSANRFADRQLIVHVHALLSTEIDPRIQPHALAADSNTPRAAPLAALADDENVVSEFVADEVVLEPHDQADLDAFLSAHAGKVVASDEIPQPPAFLHRTLSDAQRKARRFVIHIDPGLSTVDDASLAKDAVAANIGGHLRFSSTAASQLFRVITHEQAGGRHLYPNFVDRSDQSVLLTTDEYRAADDGTPVSAFSISSFQATGSRANVTGAWQFIASEQSVQRVGVAIIDAGFWLDGNGKPNHSVVNPNTYAGSVATNYAQPTSHGMPPTCQVKDANNWTCEIGSDFPSNVAEYNFVDDNYNAAGPKTDTCSGGTACPWHGNGSAAVAGGALNNYSEIAGTGGQVADLMLFRKDSSHASVEHAIQTATAWGAKVVSMSFGSPCDYWCRNFDDYDYSVFQAALDQGVVLIASAGNGDGTNGFEVGDPQYVHPCIFDGVICVGALNDQTNTAKQYSNFGASVDIWAPTDIPVSLPPFTSTSPGTEWRPEFRSKAGQAMPLHSGTSASAPFIAGIAAMMKSVSPALSSDQVRDILVNTGWKDATDSKVSAYVNARLAVETAAHFSLDAADPWEPNDSAEQAHTISPGTLEHLTLQTPRDVDFYSFSLTQRSDVDLAFTFPGDLNQLQIPAAPARTSGCASSGIVTESQDHNSHSMHIAGAMPGQYLFEVQGTGPMAYTMSLANEASPLAPDAFEPDDSPFAAARPGCGGSAACGSGDFGATIFPAGDVDYYTFDSSGSFNDALLGGLDTLFAITGSDIPLRLRLFSGGDYSHVVTEALGAADCSELPSLQNLPRGPILVAVDSPDRLIGQYTFSIAAAWHAGSGLLPRFRQVWRIPPGDPLQQILGERERTFIVDPADAKLGSQVRLTGEGLMLELLDSRGKILEVGRSVQDPSGVLVQAVQLPVSAKPQILLVRVTGIATSNQGGVNKNASNVRFSLGIQ